MWCTYTKVYKLVSFKYVGPEEKKIFTPKMDVENGFKKHGYDFEMSNFKFKIQQKVLNKKYYFTENIFPHQSLKIFTFRVKFSTQYFSC